MVFWPRRNAIILLRLGLIIFLAAAFIVGIRMMTGDEESIINELNQVANKDQEVHSFVDHEKEDEQIVHEKAGLLKPVKPQKGRRKIGKPDGRTPDEIRFDREIAEDEARIDYKLGPNGAAAFLPDKVKKEADEIMKKEAVNLMLSDRIPYNRTIPGALVFKKQTKLRNICLRL